MQTIASLATRLDMTAEEAVETLRKLHFDVDGVESEVSDEQTDMLIEVDEDPSALDMYLQEVLQREEKERKRTERLQAAAKKAAAKRKAAPKKKAAAKKKTKKGAEEEEIKAGEARPEAGLEPSLGEEAPAGVAAAVSAEAGDAPPIAVEAVEEKPRVMAEILPEAAPDHKKGDISAPALIIGVAAEGMEPPVEIVRADGTLASATDLETLEIAEEEEEEVETGLLAEAERRQEEEERRRARRSARPLPVPDPAVVAEVIRKAHERSRQKVTKARPVRPELVDKELLFRGAASRSTTPTGKTARKRQKRAERARVLEDTLRRDAAAAVKEFQSGASLLAPKRRKKRRVREDGAETTEEVRGGVIEVGEPMTVERLAEAMNMPVNELILEFMDEDILVTKNQILDMEQIRKAAEGHDFEVRAVIPEEDEVLAEEPDNPEDLVLRAPVITVMGHVDHGKTSLLDVVRQANVAAGEVGGITQHIAAYEVDTEAGRVVFLDTPGHEAFTQMRARGAKVTDVVVLVVAADDGVKPQTIEALDHAKAGDVPVVVAINKCDKPEAQPDRVRQELTQYGLLDEAWGGKTIMKNISAKTHEGVNDLLDMLVLSAQMLELKANPNKRARGAVLESELTRGLGPVAWILVQTGTLRIGDVFLAGETFGRVRSMTTSRGEQVDSAGPSTPVLVTGFSAPPDAGDVFVVTQDERIARAIAEKRALLSRQKRGPTQKRMTLEDFHERMLKGEQKSLNIVLKTDVQGSVDVLESSFARLGNEEVSVRIIHAGVGGINESDVVLASATEAVIIGFHVTANPRVQKLAEQEGVDIRTYRIIYEAIDEVRHALEGLLTPDKKEITVGHAEVRQVFHSSALGNIAGCYQLDGETTRGAAARLLRDDVIVRECRVESVRRGKEDVRTVAAGFECGIKLENFDDIQVGDIIEVYRVEEIAKTLN